MSHSQYVLFSRKKLCMTKLDRLDLQLTSAFEQRCLEALDSLEQYFRNRAHWPNLVDVFKGGSLLKGTAIGDKCNADLVIFLRHKSIESYIKHLPHCAGMTHRLMMQFECQQFEDVSVGTKIRKFWFRITLSGNDGSQFEINVIFAYHTEDLNNLQNEMLGKSPEVLEYFAPSFSRRQVEFIKNNAPKRVKQLIRHVKGWQSSLAQYGASYGIELLCVHLWRRAESNGANANGISIKQAFKDVTEHLREPSRIRVSISDWSPGVNVMPMFNSNKGFYIADPVNPVNNVLGSDETIDRLKLVEPKADELIDKSPVLEPVETQPDWTC